MQDRKVTRVKIFTDSRARSSYVCILLYTTHRYGLFFANRNRTLPIAYPAGALRRRLVMKRVRLGTATVTFVSYPLFKLWDE